MRAWFRKALVAVATSLVCAASAWSAASARPAKEAFCEERFCRVIEMEVTAYTAGPESTGKWPGHPLYGVTASGERVRRGIVAASRSLPFGTRVYVPGYGYAVVLDRGGAITEGKLDVYIEDLQAALAWGRRKTKVFIFECATEREWRPNAQEERVR